MTPVKKEGISKKAKSLKQKTRIECFFFFFKAKEKAPYREVLRCDRRREEEEVQDDTAEREKGEALFLDAFYRDLRGAV